MRHIIKYISYYTPDGELKTAKVLCDNSGNPLIFRTEEDARGYILANPKVMSDTRRTDAQTADVS